VATYSVTVERTITVEVELDADSPTAAEDAAAHAADRGDYDAQLDQADTAKHFTYGAVEVASCE
jgi:hypothetical protein